eukprot:scaffold121_cov412-Prasinococcus_capsulatus_cf.AAC.3
MVPRPPDVRLCLPQADTRILLQLDGHVRVGVSSLRQPRASLVRSARAQRRERHHHTAGLCEALA